MRGVFAESRPLKQQVRFLRKYVSNSDLVQAPLPLLNAAIDHISKDLRSLSTHIKPRSNEDMFKYIYTLAKDLNSPCFRNQPDVAWKVLKKLIGTMPGNRYSPDRTPPMLLDDQQVPVSTQTHKLEFCLAHFTKLELVEGMTDSQLS